MSFLDENTGHVALQIMIYVDGKRLWHDEYNLIFADIPQEVRVKVFLEIRLAGAFLRFFAGTLLFFRALIGSLFT